MCKVGKFRIHLAVDRSNPTRKPLQPKRWSVAGVAKFETWHSAEYQFRGFLALCPIRLHPSTSVTDLFA